MESNIINDLPTPGLFPIADDCRKELEVNIDGIQHKLNIQYNFKAIELKLKKPKDIKCLANEFSLDDIVRQLFIHPQRYDSCEKVCKYIVESISQKKVSFKIKEGRCEIVFKTLDEPKIELKEAFLTEKEMIEVLFIQNLELMTQIKDIKKECFRKIDESNNKMEEMKKQNSKIIEELKKDHDRIISEIKKENKRTVDEAKIENKKLIDEIETKTKQKELKIKEKEEEVKPVKAGHLKEELPGLILTYRTKEDNETSQIINDNFKGKNDIKITELETKTEFK